MTRFDRWLMTRIIRKETRQGYDHPAKFTALYAMITDAAKREFTEDNEETRRHYLREWFEAQFPPFPSHRLSKKTAALLATLKCVDRWINTSVPAGTDSATFMLGVIRTAIADTSDRSAMPRETP